ncbi:MAG: hypothetical protein WC657_04920, partial [Candidatus Paceibacterota bacterium]
MTAKFPALAKTVPVLVKLPPALMFKNAGELITPELFKNPTVLMVSPEDENKLLPFAAEPNDTVGKAAALAVSSPLTVRLPKLRI